MVQGKKQLICIIKVGCQDCSLSVSRKVIVWQTIEVFTLVSV